ncbi:glycosyl hydrolase [Parabacteroides pacaensis]|uniref:glycosyl hydrolase n=1 Tax=Parabacteroides pacaensis TaxID=2086575 RepID=UPI00131E0F9F|nr:glycosyl hydrolase [Parabacteroides pacaensis]
MSTHYLFLLICMIACHLPLSVFSLNEISTKEGVSVMEITFDQPGAIYHKNEAGRIIIKIPDASCQAVTVQLLDTDRKVFQEKTFNREQQEEFVINYPFKLKELGYYYVKVLARSSSGQINAEEGFGIIPKVTLTEKDWDSPFGVCGHYQRYKDWRIAGVQRKLGIAWVRDEADWAKVTTEGYEFDPYLKYLDENKLCWLALFNYVNSFNGIQDATGSWRWDKEVSLIKKYVQLHKGHIMVYESQNEPNNFGGWSKRWPHPQNQQWRPHGWGRPFADLIKQMRDSIREVDPAIKLMWPGEEEWIEYFVKERNAASSIDITSIHPYVNQKKYPETEKFATGEYAKRKRDLQQMGVPTDIWVTEVGWTTYTCSGKPDRYPPISEYEQAAFLVRTYLLHLYHGATKVFWYEMVEEPYGKENPESCFGLVNYNASLTAKPSAVAYSNMVATYRHAVPVGKYKGSEETFGFAYTRKKDNILCVWREKDSKEEVLLLEHTRKLKLTDIFGRTTVLNVFQGKAHLPLTISPVTITGIDERDFQRLYIPKAEQQ